MIVDALGSENRCGTLHPGLAEAFEHLAQVDVSALELGEHEVDGRRLYMICAEDPGRTRAGARLEAHRKYIDIQIVVGGTEVIGWKALAGCEEIDEPHDGAKDIGLFADAPDAWVELTPGTFAVFFPEDAHAPLAGEGTVRKVVVKVAVEW